MNLSDLPPEAIAPAAVAFMVGLYLLLRGLGAYRQDARVQSIATSRVASLAAGEVRLSGTVEPLVHSLISPLQSRRCVWYRSVARETGDNGRTLLREERAVEFALRDPTGEIRVVPRGARWMIADAFDETTGFLGEEPAGLDRRTGPVATVTDTAEREAAIAALLTVRPAGGTQDVDGDPGTGLGDLLGLGGAGAGSGPAMEPRRRYQEARIHPGDTITVIGYAQPWSDHRVVDTAGGAFTTTAPIDAALQADLDAARAAGTLAPDAATAWGNAAIPGFGIGRPASDPELHPDADPLPSAEPALVERAERLFEVPDHALFVSAGAGVPLTVYAGTPAEAEAHHDHGFLLGLGGAALSAASALVMVVVVTGRP